MKTVPATAPALPGVHHRLVDVGDVRLHVAQAGSGPPVLLLHGFPQNWYLWRKLIGPLATEHRVIVPDLRGAGDSDAPAGGYDKRNMAKDILGLLDALDIDEPVRLAGHDWGGWIGFIMCMTEPERFERFLALNIPPPWSNRSPRNLPMLMSALARLWYQIPLSTPWLGREITGGRFADHFFDGMRRSARNRDAWSDDSIEVYRRQFEDPARARAGTLLYRTFAFKEVPQLIVGRYLPGRRLTVPTHILFGRDDFAADERQITADHSRFADDITCELVDSCGHFIVDERPELVLERIRDWRPT